MKFNWSLGKISIKKSSRVIFLAIYAQGKTDSPKIFSINIGEKGQVSVLILPHIPSTYFDDIPPLYHPLYLQPNRKKTLVALSVVEVPEEVVEAVVVLHVVDMAVEVMGAVVIVHQFTVVMVPLPVCFSLEQLPIDQK